MLAQKMQTMKTSAGMSYQEISDKSGVPLATVKRIFSGQTPDPGYTSVIAIMEAMGGDESDIRQAVEDSEPAPAESAPSKISIKAVERICSIYEKSLKDKRKLIVGLLISNVLMIAIFIFLLILDLYTPNLGFFRR